MDHLAELRAFHQEFVEPFTGPPIGCSEEEVETLKQSLGFDLPEAYRQWLLWMGRDYDGVFRGSDCFINHVKDNTAYLLDLFAENGVQFELPEHYLVFFMHQGYVAAWFELPNTEENPDVWFFTESENTQPPHEKGKLTDFILTDMKGLARILPHIHNRRDKT